MPLPDKEYFTLDEIAQRWEVPLANVEHYAKTEKLEVCVPLLPVDAEGGTYDELGPVPNFQERQERGCYPIVLEDLWIVLRRGEVKTSQLKPYEGHAYLTVAKDFTVTRDQLVVTRAELERFETVYEVSVEGNRSDYPGVKQSQPDEHSTRYPGRPPKLKASVEGEFHRRVEANECLSTLAAEARELHEWAKETYPTSSIPTAKVIENNLRSLYNRLVRNDPMK